MSVSEVVPEIAWTVEPDLWRCVDCSGSLARGNEGLICQGCGRQYPVREGMLVVKDELTSNNRIVSDYYNSPLWPRWRFWEWLTFVGLGGERRARNKILRHLPQGSGLKLLDVAIGDGVYLPWLPQDWHIVGIDISAVQLQGCKQRAAGRDLPLVLGEAEELPFHDRRFDAVLSIGGFNYFNNPEASLREMVRVTKPGGTIIVADEVPNLTDRVKLGRWIGLPALDRKVIAMIMKNLGPDFTALVEKFHDLDIAAIGAKVLPGSTYELIWRGMGYVLVGQVPA